MKKTILLILLIFLAWYPRAQTIKGYEYWLDENYSSRVTATITPVQVFRLQQNIDMSGTADGLHVFNIRFADNSDRWSSTLSSLFIKNPYAAGPSRLITGYEYWIDDNYTGRTYQAVAASAQYRLTGNIDFSALPDGIHIFNIRFRDDQGSWSPAVSQFFMKITPVTPVTRLMVAYEYWIDENYAGKIYQAVTPTSQIHIIQNFDLSSLPDGLHSMNIRFKDSQETWSCAVSQYFLKSAPVTPVTRHVTEWEYWVDEGFASRISTAVTPGIQVQILANLDMNAHSDGIHVINFRFRDDTGMWSSAMTQFFLKRSPATAIVPNLMADYRFWFDDNMATMETFTVPGTPVICMLSDTVETPFLTVGTHTINYQFKDTNEVYSSVRTDTFNVTSCLPHGGRIITGAADVCAGSQGISYSIRAIKNADTYTWSVPSGASIVSGDNTHAIVVDYTSSAISGNVTVYATNSCGNGETVILPVTVHQPPVPQITGNVSVCTGLPGTTYTTEPGNLNYTWTVSPGNTITAGGGTGHSYATVAWNVNGNQWIRVSYTSPAGCVATAPAQLDVSVGVLPAAAGAITGPTNVAPGQIGVIYSVSPIPNATGYSWNLPVGASVFSGNNTNTITVNFAESAISGNITVWGTNLCGQGEVSPALAVTILSNTLTVNKHTVGNGITECFNAVQTIYVAGGADGAFAVMAGGSATFIAGQNIFFRNGTRVYSGGYLHAWITTTGQYCNSARNPLVEAQDGTGDPDPASLPFPDSHIRHSHIRIFPNPTSGMITIAPAGEPFELPVTAEIFNLMGTRVIKKELEHTLKNDLSLAGLPRGVYLVLVQTVGWREIVLVVRE